MTATDRQLAVVIVSYNTRALLLECLASVFASTRHAGVEVIVVDNASEDGSYEAVKTSFPQATAIRNAANLGFGAACNLGIQNSSSPFILLLNSDARLTTEALKAMCDCLERNDRCGAAGCNLIDSTSARVNNAFNFLTPLNQALETAGMKLGTRALQRTHRLAPDGDLVDCSVDWMNGACLMLRRKALDEAGIFDERFFMYSEDEDLCFRLRRKGWVVCSCGAGTAVHHGAASTQRSRAEMLRHFYLSQLLFLSKHRGDRSAFFYGIAMKTVLMLKHSLLWDSGRRENAREQLKALREACNASKPKR